MSDNWEEACSRLADVVLHGKGRLAEGSPVASLELDAYSVWWRDLSYVVDVYQAGSAALSDRLPGFALTGLGGLRWSDPEASQRAVACTHAAALCTSLADFLSVFTDHALSESPEARERVRARYAPGEALSVALERVETTLNPFTTADPGASLDAVGVVFDASLPALVTDTLADLLDHREQLAHLSSRTACPAPSFAQMQAWSFAVQALGALVALSVATHRARRVHTAP